MVGVEFIFRVSKRGEQKPFFEKAKTVIFISKNEKRIDNRAYDGVGRKRAEKYLSGICFHVFMGRIMKTKHILR